MSDVLQTNKKMKIISSLVSKAKRERPFFKILLLLSSTVIVQMIRFQYTVIS